LLLKPWYYNVQEIRNIVGDADHEGISTAIEVLLNFFAEGNIRMNFMGFPLILDNVDIKDILIWNKE